MSEASRRVARAIFARALQAVDVGAAVRRHIQRQGDMLMLAGRPVSLGDIDRVLVIAMGKAAVPMYRAAAEGLDGFRHQAVVVAPVETLPALSGRGETPRAGTRSGVMFLTGPHPTPSADSAVAAETILEALRNVTNQTVVLFLISGGASAMVEKTLDPAITLDDLAAFSRALVGSGLAITAMNTLRKHCSAVKGGRLAVVAADAKMQCTLLISDVPAAWPDAIASGPSLPDTSTVEETRLLFRHLQQTHALPETVTAWFQSAALPETPKAGDSAFDRAHCKVILSGDHLARAAVLAAESEGLHAVVDNTCDDWEYQKAAHYLLDRSRDLATQRHGSTCLVSVGEVGVSLTPHAGEGGRNQQFALLCAAFLATHGRGATVLSAGSDGVDGQSSAAGAVCDETTVHRASAAGLSVPLALAGFNTTPLLRDIGDSLHTGPTGNNLRDLRLILTEPQ